MQHIRTMTLLSMLLSSACAPATVQLARSSGKGTFELGIEPGAVGSVDEDGFSALPTFNLAGRYGVSDRLDLGGRIGTSLYELQFKYMFTDPAATDEMAISIAPSSMILGGGLPGIGGALYWSGRVPVLFGVPMGEGSELTFGPAASTLFAGGGGLGSSATGFVLSLGGQVGYAARVADNFWIVPQLDFGVPVVVAVATTGNGKAEITGGGQSVGLQLGFLIDVK